jgi:stringent starvation protein B
MTPNKPYLIRALYEWLEDNHATPYIMVDSTQPGVDIPAGVAQDGKVVLNIAQRAVQGLQIDNEYIAFSARFSGVSQNVYIPIQAVMAIYSMEDGEGMMFADPEPAAEREETGNSEKPAQKDAKSRPGLKIVK